MRARSRPSVLRNVGKAAEAASIALVTSLVLSSGHVPISLPVAGSIDRGVSYGIQMLEMAAITVNLEGLAGLGTNPLAIDVRLLNEERLVFQLLRPLALNIGESDGSTHLRRTVSHGVESLSVNRRWNSKRISRSRSEKCA
jgi:hypothetical protein